MIISKSDFSPLMFEEHILPPALRKSKTQSDLQNNDITYANLGCELMKDSRSIQSKYQALKSHLIKFIKDNHDKEKDEKYHKKKNALATKVLTAGTQLHAIYSLFSKEKHHGEKIFSDLHIKKKDLTNELFYCEYLLDTPHKNWNQYKAGNEQISDITVDSIIRFITSETNWYRLFMIRVKRLFTNIMPLIKSINYQWFVYQINRINPILSYVAWLFYVPRLSADLYSLFIHTVPSFWMGEEEKALGFTTRLNMHWGRLWFEILNDAVWLAVGLACCFFLSAGGSILLTAGLYFFDAGMAYANNYFSVKHHKELRDTLSIQMNRLNVLLNQITDSLPKSENSAITESSSYFDGKTVKEELEILEEYQEHINLWINYEQKKLVLSMFVTTMFAISMTIGALPTLLTLGSAMAIACPIISACIVVAVCITQYILSVQIEANMPETNIAQLTDLQEQLNLSHDHKQTKGEASIDEDELYTADSPISANQNSFFGLSPAKLMLRKSLSCPEDLRDLTTGELSNGLI